MMLAQLADHLWQSTLFALGVAAATLAFRRDRAAVRHAMWLAASIKFLIPFAALVAVGAMLGVRPAAVAPVDRETIVVIKGADPALALPIFDLPVSTPAVSNAAAAMNRWLPLVFPLWAAGSIVILAGWMIRWRRVAAIARAARPIAGGRDFAMLRTIEGRAGRRKPIAFVASDAALEPGVFGILRPVLVWPVSIAQHLDSDQAATILAHEVSHVRRRDNLVAAVHVLVEALFWFHPLVWWIGARLVDERERACDEAVLGGGSEPAMYAATILKACRLYLESPLACVAGVTGSDLTRRIERIMTSPRAQRLSRARKALLAAGVIATVAAPIASGAVSPPKPRVERRSMFTTLRAARPLTLQVTPQATSELPQFEVASVKPNRSDVPKVEIQTLRGGRFIATNVTVRFLIQYAYGLQPDQMVGGPSWLNSDRFDIVAKGNPDQTDQMRLMLRALLADRFQLGVRTEARDLPIYALVVARKDGKLGPKITPSTVDCKALDDAKEKPQLGKVVDKAGKSGDAPGCGIRIGGGQGTMVVGGASLAQVASSLSPWVGRLVVDRTGLAGNFDLTLSWTPDRVPQGLDKKVAAGGLAPADPNGPSIFTAVQEQLGLKLDAQKGPVQVLIIDRAERPREN